MLFTEYGAKSSQLVAPVISIHGIAELKLITISTETFNITESLRIFFPISGADVQQRRQSTAAMAYTAAINITQRFYGRGFIAHQAANEPRDCQVLHFQKPSQVPHLAIYTLVF